MARLGQVFIDGNTMASGDAAPSPGK